MKNAYFNLIFRNSPGKRFYWKLFRFAFLFTISLFMFLHCKGKTPVLIANDDQAMVSAGDTLRIDLLQNDKFPAEGLQITIQEKPTKGSVSLRPDYSVLYVANDFTSGNDQFTYQISFEKHVALGNVIVTIQPKTDADKAAESPTDENKVSREMAELKSADMDDFMTKYFKALNQFQSRNYQQANGILSDLMKQYPSHKLTSNCQYWIGECFFGSKKYRDAIASFQSVLTYDFSYKKDDATLMLGRCYALVGDKQTAKTYFQNVITNFPKSEYINKAREHLDKLETF